MPFLKESLKELRKRECLSQERFGRSLEKFAKERGMIKKSGRYKFSVITMGQWERGESNPRLKHLDLLYQYAKSKGYNDLEFYSPTKK